MTSLPAKEGANIGAPHIVILGAGASIAAYNDWGNVGPPLPSMLNIADLLKLTDLIKSAGFDPIVNFENLYDQLAFDPEHSTLRDQLEQRVYEYFLRLSLPDTPTIYDYLILALREKDVIGLHPVLLTPA